MPLIWKRLTLRYLKTTLLCSSGLILMMIVAFLQEIATFIGKEVSLPAVLKMTAYQIPYLLPWIIPIACFVAALQLFKSLSANNQMIFLRSSGASNFMIMFPVLATSALLGILNFYSASELASVCRSRSCAEIAQIAISSPSFLLQTIQKSASGKIFIVSEDCSKGRFHNTVACFRNDNSLSNICLIKNAFIDVPRNQFTAENVTLFSEIPQTFEGTDDSNMLLEHIDELIIPKIKSGLIRQNGFSPERIDYMPIKKLIQNMSSQSLSSIKPYIIEIMRRIAIGFLCVSLTFAGIVLGNEKPRFKRHRKIFYLLPILSLVLLILGKNNTSKILAGTFFFIIPQLTIWIFFSHLSLKEKKGICL